jgi:hypothetical protein
MFSLAGAVLPKGRSSRWARVSKQHRQGRTPAAMILIENAEPEVNQRVRLTVP